VKTAAIALAPLAFTPVLVLLLMAFGPERSVLFAIYWIVPAVVFAIAMPLMRRRGRNLLRASLLGAAWALGVMVVVFVVAFVASLYFVPPAVGAVPPRPPQSPDAARPRERGPASDVPAG
jgi:hypothetical protein